MRMWKIYWMTGMQFWKAIVNSGPSIFQSRIKRRGGSNTWRGGVIIHCEEGRARHGSICRPSAAVRRSLNEWPRCLIMPLSVEWKHTFWAFIFWVGRLHCVHGVKMMIKIGWFLIFGLSSVYFPIAQGCLELIKYGHRWRGDCVADNIFATKATLGM